MCFYVKRHLDYKPHVTPTYIEAARELEREKLEKEKEAAARMKEVEDDLLGTIS